MVRHNQTLFLLAASSARVVSAAPAAPAATDFSQYVNVLYDFRIVSKTSC